VIRLVIGNPCRTRLTTFWDEAAILKPILIFVATTLACSLVFAQQKPAPQHLPRVLNLDTPFYPPMGRKARIQGVVHIRVKTDGKAIVATEVLDGQPLLADAAQKNLKTWKFEPHVAMSFEVEYRFRLLTSETGPIYLTWDTGASDARVVLNLPREVELTAVPIYMSDPALDPR